MPIIAAAPPQQLATSGNFDYVAVDTIRRRVYAAHPGGLELTIVNADTGKIIGSVKFANANQKNEEWYYPESVAVDSANGHVFTGDGNADAISEVDPVASREIRRVVVTEPVGKIAYDPQLHRIYADGENEHLLVIDSKTFKEIGEITLPGHKLEDLQIDSKTHEVFQNIWADKDGHHQKPPNILDKFLQSEIAVIDPNTLTITRMIVTPELQLIHPLRFDPAFDVLWVGGENGKLSLYSVAGRRLYTVDSPTQWSDQCDLDRAWHLLACGIQGKLAIFTYDGKSAPHIVGETGISQYAHTMAIDPKKHRIWMFWANWNERGHRAFFEPFSYTP